MLINRTDHLYASRAGRLGDDKGSNTFARDARQREAFDNGCLFLSGVHYERLLSGFAYPSQYTQIDGNGSCGDVRSSLLSTVPIRDIYGLNV